MSRHLLLDRPDRQIVLGYDHMLRSFFGQVFRPNDRRRDGIAVAGWPTKSGLGMRRPVETHEQAAADLDLLMAWADQQLFRDGSFDVSRDHAARLKVTLRREWDDGEDAPEIPLPSYLRGGGTPVSNAAHALPARLREAAAAIANARAGRRGAPPITDVLDILPTRIFDEVVEDARAALDAAAAAAPDPSERPTDRGKLRINVAAAAGLDLYAQAVVLIDVARDGTVTTSTYARRPGTPARAIAEWADGLWTRAITAVPFRTVFGWGHGGVPTPLTPDERATLSKTQAAYADRNSEEPQP